ncbi:MAG: sigma-54 dependent transcriptional regulator [candidate division Zixibacteria bacterium]|nr:sigma-54 dependent transcriptional regulator [candidate division Zixibacteria bacterium]
MSEAPRHKILLVDDDPDVLEVLGKLFSGEYAVILASSGEEAVARFKEHADIAAVVMDIRMPDMDGITAARQIKRISADPAIIFHTGYPGDYDEEEIDKEEKPFDYVLKGESISRLTRSVRNAVDTFHMRKDCRQRSDLAELKYGLVGRSAGMQDVYERIHKLSQTDGKVMILGETGTGKELVARAIHFNSRRKNEHWMIINCNHRPPGLVESELFGHVKGAFTDAVADRVGYFEIADRGTVMLDEIADLDKVTQGKILRVLETGEFQRLGASEWRKTNIRIICATNKNLEKMVHESAFRDDLYFRLKGVHIFLPPLRDRKSDIPLLIDRFVQRLCEEYSTLPKVFDQSAIDVLLSYDWPGNVRELLDTVESLITLSDSDIILAEDVRNYLDFKYTDFVVDNENRRSLNQRVRDFTAACIVQALTETHSNVAAAARQLGVDRANLRKMIRRYGIAVSKRQKSGAAS